MARRRSNPNSFIATLEAKQEKIRRQIAIEKKKVRQASRVLHARRARVLGEAMLRLAEHGEIDNQWRQQVLDAVTAHANDNDRAALTGTYFDIGPEPEPTLQPEQSFGILRKRVLPSEDK